MTMENTLYSVVAIFIIVIIVPCEGYAVKGRLNPATMGAFKTSHFEERKVCHKYSPTPTMTGFKENDCGKPTQDGCGKRNIDIKDL